MWTSDDIETLKLYWATEPSNPVVDEETGETVVWALPSGNSHLSPDAVNDIIKKLVVKASVPCRHVTKEKRIKGKIVTVKEPDVKFHLIRKYVFSAYLRAGVKTPFAKLLIGKAVPDDISTYLTDDVKAYYMKARNELSLDHVVLVTGTLGEVKKRVERNTRNMQKLRESLPLVAQEFDVLNQEVFEMKAVLNALVQAVNKLLPEESQILGRYALPHMWKEPESLAEKIKKILESKEEEET